jgi:hypothetical protein
VEEFARMKTINLLCALGLFVAVAAVKADEPKTNAPAAVKPVAKGESAAVIKTTEGTMVVEFWPEAAQDR